MQIGLLVRVIFAVALTTSAAEAEEVTLSHKGLTLNADLELAAGEKPDGGVILITHGTLAHRDMEVITQFRTLLADYGYSTLAINLGLGIDNRHGMYDCATTHRHRNDDAVAEIDAWVEWLKGQGAGRVMLLGHSRGGAQTALYLAERDNPAVQASILLAPAMRDNGGAGYERRYGKPLAPVLDKAQKLIADGKGDTVLDRTDFLSCPDASVTADAFVSYYGPDPRLDTPSLLLKLRKPTLVVVAGGDQIVVGLDKKVAPLADGERVQMVVVDDADHFFRDLFADDAVQAIDEFLQGLDD